MFFSLVAFVVTKDLYWNITGLTLHGKVLLVTWLAIIIILTIALLGTLKLKLILEGLQKFSENVFEYVAFITKEQLGE